MSIKTAFKKARAWVTGAVLALLASIGLYHPVESQTPAYTVTLTLPTQRADNSALPLSQIASYTVAYKVGAGAYTLKVVNGPFTTLAQTTTTPRVFGTTCHNVYVTDTGGLVGAATSPDICVTTNAPPNPPSNVTVN
ncbi:MAG: hypothetical protein QM813_17025 [Verrucomicrobiota bacterium]